MTKLSKMLLVGIVAIGGLSTDAFADNVGYIDMQRLNQAYPAAQKAEQDFQKKYQDYQKLVEEKQKRIEDLKAKKKKDEEVKAAIDATEKELKPKQDELFKLRNDLLTKLQSDILAVTKQVAKEYGIDVVIQKEAVISGGFDLTDFVIEKLKK